MNTAQMIGAIINTNKECECEHVAHLDSTRRTPNGNPGHKYLQAFNALSMIRKHTPFGPYEICTDCANDCYAHVTKDQM